MPPFTIPSEDSLSPESISAKISAKLFDSEYNDSKKSFHLTLVDDLIKQYKSKSDLYDTQKEILYLHENNIKNKEDISDKIQLKKRKIFYNEKEARKKVFSIFGFQFSLYDILKILLIILSIIAVILLIVKPLTSPISLNVVSQSVIN